MELKLLTFNVRYENPEDPELRSWRSRIIGITRMIRSENPDVFGVQEALHGQAADLRASLPDFGFAGVAREDGKRRGEYAALFYRKSRFHAAEGGHFWLSATPEIPGSKTWGNSYPRMATWLRLIDRNTGRSFHVYNTHWDHRNQPSREKAAELIHHRIATRSHPGGPVVLLGDFNAVETNTGLRTLTAGTSGLEDTFQKLHAGEKNRTTLHLWRGTKNGSLKVDHILVSPETEILESAIRTSDVPMISDHFPVTARVVLH